MEKKELKLFYQEIDIRRQQWGLTWAQVQAQSGIGLTARIQMAQGTELSAEDMAKAKGLVETWAGGEVELGVRAIGLTDLKVKTQRLNTKAKSQRLSEVDQKVILVNVELSYQQFQYLLTFQTQD